MPDPHAGPLPTRIEQGRVTLLSFDQVLQKRARPPGVWVIGQVGRGRWCSGFLGRGGSPLLVDRRARARDELCGRCQHSSGARTGRTIVCSVLLPRYEAQALTAPRPRLRSLWPHAHQVSPPSVPHHIQGTCHCRVSLAHTGRLELTLQLAPTYPRAAPAHSIPPPTTKGPQS